MEAYKTLKTKGEAEIAAKLLELSTLVNQTGASYAADLDQLNKNITILLN